MLYRKYSEMDHFEIDDMRGGTGRVKVTHLLKPQEMLGKGRLFADNVIPPGGSIGLHPHEGDVEAYYFLEGKGLYQNGDETEFEVEPGDLTFVDDHQSHGIKNIGDVPLRFIALILFTGENK